jgi:hypothetical protein
MPCLCGSIKPEGLDFHNRRSPTCGIYSEILLSELTLFDQREKKAGLKHQCPAFQAVFVEDIPVRRSTACGYENPVFQAVLMYTIKPCGGYNHPLVCPNLSFCHGCFYITSSSSIQR